MDTTPYLIQRARFRPLNQQSAYKHGIDKLILFDYMGSSEFEFGALPKSLKVIRENILKYVSFDYTFNANPNKAVTCFCLQSQQQDMPEILEKLYLKEYRLKKYSDVDHFVNKEYKPNERRTEFWWDIKNNFMFWAKDDLFSMKFMSELQPN